MRSSSVAVASRWFYFFIGLCTSALGAAFVCWLGRHFEPKTSLPILFLAVIAVIAIRTGSVAGIVGTCLATIIFALFLFAPIGSIAIAEPVQRVSLAWFALGGISISFLIGTGPPSS